MWFRNLRRLFIVLACVLPGIINTAHGDVNVGKVAIYDGAMLGDAGLVIYDENVTLSDEEPPAFLLPLSEDSVFQIPGFNDDPKLKNDCEVVEEWATVSQYFTNVTLGIAIYEASANVVEAQALGAVDLAVALLDSVNAPPASACPADILCGFTIMQPVSLSAEPCRKCAVDVSNVAVEYLSLVYFYEDLVGLRSKAFGLVNSVVAKIANPGSFPPEDYGCDRVCAMYMRDNIESRAGFIQKQKDEVFSLMAGCTLESAMAGCEACPESNSLLKDVGTIVSDQFAAGAFQAVPPEPILDGVADALERAIRTTDDRELYSSMGLMIRRLRSLEESGNVLHVVVPAMDDTSQTFIAIGCAQVGEDDSEGWEDTKPLSAVVFTAAQRDSGLPVPNYNDFTKIRAAKQAFSRRVPPRLVNTLEDLEKNAAPNRILPDWRRYIPVVEEER